ncbi:MAG: diadenylate cyclase CdaA [Candidatus Omnitrophica bacterium]|nr:diadenylate cyclase CdaA [Candidatus Omnitrophota bacterium]
MLEQIADKILGNWKAIVEIVILWFVFYRILLFLKGTKAVYVIRGIFILVVAFFVFQKLGFNTLNWILTKIFALSVIALMIIFQPELRGGLSRLGQRPLFYTGFREEEMETLIREVTSAVSILAKKRIGALLAIQREIGLKNYIESGVSLDALVSSEVLQTIFTPNSPLHDGGVIIQRERIAAASCLFPLSDNPQIDKSLGMRHRAGIGLSEETDALVIIVSEERGTISLAINGRITPNLKREDLTTILKGLLKRGKKR